MAPPHIASSINSKTRFARVAAFPETWIPVEIPLNKRIETFKELDFVLGVRLAVAFVSIDPEIDFRGQGIPKLFQQTKMLANPDRSDAQSNTVVSQSFDAIHEPLQGTLSRMKRNPKRECLPIRVP